MYVAIPSPRPSIMLLLPWLPDVLFGYELRLNIFVRNLLIRLPPFLRPKPGKMGAVLVLDAKDGAVKAEYYDVEGETIEMVTAVSERNGKLYLGSLVNQYVGVFTPPGV